MSKSDSERIAGYLDFFGFQEVDKSIDASLIIMVTCGIRQSAEDRIYGLAHKFRKENKNAKIVLTGCLSDRKDVQRRLKNKIDAHFNIIFLPDFYLQLNNLFSLKLDPGKEFHDDYLKIKPKLKFKVSALVPIGNGCDNFCSYCVVPYARGREIYRNMDDIIEEVEALVKNGYKEITLIAQNVNSYFSQDKNGDKVKFPQLLRQVANIQGDFWLRFLTSNPKDMTEELIDVIVDNEKISRHIHLPIQSGNNVILDKMNRKYTKEHYYNLIEKIKNKISDVSLTTDVIVGFPGETEEQFLDTLEVFEKVEYDMAYISKYSPRPGTSANKMEDNVSREEKKRREERLTDIFQKTALKNNKKFLNKVCRVLISGKTKDGLFFGKTLMEKNVRIEDDKDINEDLIGKFFNVKITSMKGYSFYGILIK